ncbi:MAG: ubiquinol-cytochrome c reductase iron-sulfur subunit [Pseudomonadota bacterium]
MTADAMDLQRRRFLTLATTAMGAVGTAYVAVPFVASWQPSARAKALGAPVEADIGKLEPGQILRVKWRGQPVWVVYRTEQNIVDLKATSGSLLDPSSEASQQPGDCQNALRSKKPKYLVAVGICTHLGCSPLYRPEVAPADLGPEWKGGFYCPCHGSVFDLAGRVAKGVPAPANLKIPPYRFINDSLILIGEDGGAT